MSKNTNYNATTATEDRNVNYAELLTDCTTHELLTNTNSLTATVRAATTMLKYSTNLHNLFFACSQLNFTI